MTPVDPSTVASWGRPEDRPERERMRANLIGLDYMAAFRKAEGGKKKHPCSWWFKWMRENTALELRWMWSSARAFKDEDADAYAQVAGELILEETAKGNVLSTRWFRTDISELFGWLFEPACLEHDGWLRGDIEASDGKMYRSWIRPKR